MFDIQNLKNKMNPANLQKELEKLDTSKKKDDRFWKLTKDITGSGAAVIRFIPSQYNESHYISLLKYNFSGPSGLYYNNLSLKTIGKPDPVYEYNGEIWKKYDETKNESLKRSLKKLQKGYISNIYVVKDPANPENEGKVFLYNFTPSIFNFIKGALYPESDVLNGEVAPVNVFCPWTGANFEIKCSKKTAAKKGENSFTDYSKSKFYTPSPLLAGNDVAIAELLKKTYKLSDFISEDKFQSYDELKNRLERVLAEKRPLQSLQKAPQTQIQESEEPLVEDGEISSDEMGYLSSLEGRSSDDFGDEI